MENCIFCKIISGEIASYTLYEDDLFKVILDAFPSSVGHTLILTKNHYNDLFDLPEKEAEKIMTLAKKCALAIKQTLNCDGVNILQNNGSAAGQTVSHYHIHIIPRYENDRINMGWETVQPDTDKFKKVVDKISMYLKV
jgi:histidine triad (HIT) family protein